MTTTVPTPATARRLGLRDRCWRRCVHYPAAHLPYRPTGDLDTLTGLRRMIWLLKIAMLAMAGLLCAVITGHGVPSWFNTALYVVAGLAVFAMPGSLSLFRALLLWQIRPGHCEALMDAGIPLAWVARMGRSPRCGLGREAPRL